MQSFGIERTKFPSASNAAPQRLLAVQADQVVVPGALMSMPTL